MQSFKAESALLYICPYSGYHIAGLRLQQTAGNQPISKISLEVFFDFDDNAPTNTKRWQALEFESIHMEPRNIPEVIVENNIDAPGPQLASWPVLTH